MFLWWIWLPLLLLVLAGDLWVKYRRTRFINSLNWIILEIKPPKDIKKTPYSMEQIFAGLHGIHSGPNFKDWFMDGVFQRWFSFEMISQSGEVRFLIRTVDTFRDLVEAQVYSQYPEAEITQIDDYVNSVPETLPNDDYGMWGTELVLVKEDGYPIRTYPQFEKDAKSDDQRVDPISGLLEVMSKIKQGEQVWIQTLIRPVDDTWKKEGEKLRDKLVGRKEEKKQGAISKEIDAWKDVTRAVTRSVATGEGMEFSSSSEDSKDDPMFMWKTTKGEQDVVSAIEQNISKIGFETIIRIIYLGPQDTFNMANVNAIFGSIKQVNTQHLNAFKPNGKVTPSLDYWYQAKKQRVTYRKKRVFADYKKRAFCQYSDVIKYLNKLSFEKLPILNWLFIRSKPFVLNIEELATMYHFPSEPVKTPLLSKVESKKGEPPMGLPVQE